MVALQTDLNLGADWLHQMERAALQLEIPIQYCMALPRHGLQSLNLPAVTQVRRILYILFSFYQLHFVGLDPSVLLFRHHLSFTSVYKVSILNTFLASRCLFVCSFYSLLVLCSWLHWLMSSTRFSCKFLSSMVNYILYQF